MNEQAAGQGISQSVLLNPALWNPNVIEETLQRFRVRHPETDELFDHHNTEQLIKDYLHTLSDVIEKEMPGKMKLDVRSLSEFRLPDWVK